MLLPKISAKGISGVLKSEAVVAVGAAMVFGTLAASKLTELIGNVPFLSDHITIGLIAVAIIILLIAVKLKGGLVRGIAIGLAGGAFFIGLLQIDAVSNILAKIAPRG